MTSSFFNYSDIDLPKREDFKTYKEFLLARAEVSASMFQRNHCSMLNRINNYADAVHYWRSFVGRYYALKTDMKWVDRQDPARGVYLSIPKANSKLSPTVKYPLTDIGNLRKSGVGNVHGK